MSTRTVVRNLGLLALAVVGIAGISAFDDVEGGRRVGAFVAGLALGAAVLAAEGAAGARARARRAAAEDAAFDQEPAHTLVGPFSLPDLAGVAHALSDLLAPGVPVLLVTLSPGCGPCKRLRPDVARWAELFAGTLSVVALATGTREANLSSYADLPGLPVLVDEAGEVRDTLGTGAAPSAVVIGPDGRLASAVAGGEAMVRRLLVATITGTVPESPVERPVAEVDGIEAADLDLDAAVGPRPGVEQHRLGESVVLLDPATGATVALDQIGSLVWSVLDGSSPLREIVADVAEVYGVPAEVVGPDLLHFVRTVGAAGLLAGVITGPAPADDPQPVRAG